MRRAVLLALLLAGLAAAPARAVLVWQDAGAALPARYDLRAASALSDGTVVAAGRDSVAGTPAIARRVQGVWALDALPAVDHGDLVDTAISTAGAWAVGWTKPDTEPKPLLLRLGTDGWESVDAPHDMKAPRSVALVGADGAIADGAGHVFAIKAGVVDQHPLPLDDPTGKGLGTPDGRPIDGLALTGPADGVAVAGGGAASDGFRQVTAGKVADARATPGGTGLEAVAVVAGPVGQATAAEGPAPCDIPATLGKMPEFWTLGAGGIWQHQTLPGATATSRLCDVALSGADTVIAGERDGRAAVWRAGGRDDLPFAPLRGLAAAGDDLWAVGDAGTVLRYAPAPPPPDTTSTDSGSTTTTATTDTTSASTQADPAPEPQETRQEAPSVTVTQPRPPAPAPAKPAPLPREPAKPKPAAPAKPAGRMLTGLKVRRQGSRLVLTFRLSDRARVLVRGRVRNRLVAHATRTLAAGPVRLIVPFSGHRPPTRLAIVVRAADPRSKQSSRRTSR